MTRRLYLKGIMSGSDVISPPAGPRVPLGPVAERLTEAVEGVVEPPPPPPEPPPPVPPPLEPPPPEDPTFPWRRQWDSVFPHWAVTDRAPHKPLPPSDA